MTYYNVCEQTQFIREKLTYHMKNAKMKMRWSMFLCFALAASFLLSGMTGALAAKSKKTSDTDTKLIAFTFDDGPGDYTDMLLDGLEEGTCVQLLCRNGIFCRYFHKAVLPSEQDLYTQILAQNQKLKEERK